MSYMQLGIDLGTTYSVAAKLNSDDEPKIIRNNNGYNKTPSVVQIRENETLVGSPAVREKMMYPDQTIERVKRHMGEEDWSVEVAGEEYTPEAVSARILAKIKGDVEEMTDESVEEVVITVPAYFGNKEREATMNAARAAGFNEENGFEDGDVSLLAEPIAACMRYGANAVGETVFVYDLGGGTFDATVVEITETANGDLDYRVDGTEGGQRLGGEDFDDKLYDVLKSTMLDEGHPDPDDNDALRFDIYENVRELKHALSDADEASIGVNIGGEVFSETMERSEFEDLTENLVEETLNKTEKLFDHKNVENDKEDIDRVLLVGGSTRIPLVKERVEEYFGIEPSVDLEQDFVVAEGAAIATDEDLGGDGGNVPRTIGVTVKDTDSGELKMADIIEKNTEAPATKSKDDLKKVDVESDAATFEILEGEKTLREADNNEVLGEIELTNLEPGENPTFELTYEVDEDGRLHARAKNLDTGQQVDTTVHLGLEAPEIKDIGGDITDEMDVDTGIREEEGQAD
jgi:molecular chaperone DnaK